ncbi:hypothetical protein [Breoghania sp.]|uniref:hypothetical protein n=1 Tax=Breoghania sp. TaxID=2065378 RepID=UPI0026103231|nr:hypothetical protein [Breoghania sp.]MDJ0929888.1 hypothetical protein [Breoghania sp.]
MSEGRAGVNPAFGQIANLTSVRNAVLGVHIIQFIADPRFFAGADPVEGATLFTNDWQRPAPISKRCLRRDNSAADNQGAC